MPAPRGPIRIICGIDDDGEIQAYGVDAEGNLCVGIYNAIAGANVASWHSIEGTGDRAALLVAGQMFYFDGTNYRRVQGEAAGGVPYSGPHGWISGAWQKQPILMGFSARIRGLFTVTAVGAGDYEALTTAVPPGEVHYINFVSAYHDDPVSRSIFAYARGAGMNHGIATWKDSVAGVIQVCDSAFVLGPGDQLRVKIYSMADTKKLTCLFWGRRIDTDL
ncbi:hypothetical protein ES708_14223 [subsurface metagenome]